MQEEHENNFTTSKRTFYDYRKGVPFASNRKLIRKITDISISRRKLELFDLDLVIVKYLGREVFKHWTFSRIG